MRERLQQLIDTNEFEFLKTMSEEDIWKFAFAILYAFSERKERTGHWIERESGTEDKENGFETVIVCSHCDFPATTFYSEDCESRTQIRTHFCPNCGCRMVEPQESEE